jgi:cytochrome c556
MTTSSSLRHLFLALAISATSIAIAGDDPAHERNELMEGVRDAAKPVGAMLKGEKEFDADTLQRSLATFAKASEKLGDLVPEGSEGGEAAPAIWEDPDGFAAAIQEWSDAISAAVDANPHQTGCRTRIRRLQELPRQLSD